VCGDISASVYVDRIDRDLESAAAVTPGAVASR
jgi:hypothetical protein